MITLLSIHTRKYRLHTFFRNLSIVFWNETIRYFALINTYRTMIEQLLRAQPLLSGCFNLTSDKICSLSGSQRSYQGWFHGPLSQHRGIHRVMIIIFSIGTSRANFLPFNIDCVWEKFKFKISTDSEWLLNVKKSQLNFFFIRSQR